MFEGVVSHDTVTDFEVGVDLIDFTACGPISLADALAVAQQSGADVLLDLGSNGSVLLTGSNLEDLSISDFKFEIDLGDDVVMTPEIFELG